MSNAARLPAVRSVADLQKIKTEAREKQEISVQRLGAISRKASTIREEAETVIRLCEKYQHFLSDDEVGLGPAVRLAMSCEARAAIRTVLGRIETVCDEISGGAL